MTTRPIFNNIVIAAAAFLFLVMVSGSVHADEPAFKEVQTKYKTLGEKLEHGVYMPLLGYHIFWQQGLNVISPKQNLSVKIGGKIIVDGGYIDADDELDRAFPDLTGSYLAFRELSVDVLGTIYKNIDVKFEIDFANVRDIKDNWIRFSQIPYLQNVRFGNMKEPFSLEEQTSISAITFMERALPVDAFSPGRNIGIRYDHPESDSPINWAAGIFLNTGSFGTLGEGSNQISEANGVDITARISGIPLYREAGRKLLHLGLSYVHGIRTGDDVQARARPESRLTDDRLVDTGTFPADGTYRIGTELAIVSGPLSFQGEFMYAVTDADTVGDPDFWGGYAYLSYFITGEHRRYNRSKGVFYPEDEKLQFHPLKGDWGAWELGLRFSYVDLNDGAIYGGREGNLTAGLSWYYRKNIRMMLNYINANVKGRANPPPVENGTADILQVRFQIVF